MSNQQQTRMGSYAQQPPLENVVAQLVETINALADRIAKLESAQLDLQSQIDKNKLK